MKTASKRAIQKTAKATGDFIGNKSGVKITKVSKSLLYSNPETVTKEEENIGLDREIPRERYISPENRYHVINNLRLI